MPNEIFQCTHCHFQSKVKMKNALCSDCGTTEKRKAMDEENLKINPKFWCDYDKFHLENKK